MGTWSSQEFYYERATINDLYTLIYVMENMHYVVSYLTGFSNQELAHPIYQALRYKFDCEKERGGDSIDVVLALRDVERFPIWFESWDVFHLPSSPQRDTHSTLSYLFDLLSRGCLYVSEALFLHCLMVAFPMLLSFVSLRGVRRKRCLQSVADTRKWTDSFNT